MAQPGPRRLETFTIAKGCSMEMWVDDSKPADSIERKWSLVIYDGKPDSDLAEVPNHWHKFHDEHMTVVEGEVNFTLDGKKLHLKQGDETFIARGKVHSLKSIPGSRLVLKEATDPAGDFKEDFFLDVFSLGWPVGFWHIHRVFFDHDVYPALGLPGFLGGQYVDQAYINVVGRLAKWVSSSKKPLEAMRKDAQEGRYQ